MKKLLIVALSIVAGANAVAQQDPLYAQYINNPFLINPAYAGYTRDLNVMSIYRKQWAGFTGSPTTMNASGQVALSKNKMGAGLMLMEDKIGSHNSTEVQGFYAYHLPISSDYTLSFGLQVGAVNYRTDYSDLTINPNDPKFTTTSEWLPTFGSGLLLTSEKVMLGLSLPKMLEAPVDSPARGLYNRHFYATAAYVMPLSYRLKIKPYALYRSSANAKSSIDLGGMLYGDDSYALGLFTRNLSTYGLLAQLKLGDLMRIAYVFELPTNQSAGLNFTSHEVMIGLRMRAFVFHDLDAIRNF